MKNVKIGANVSAPIGYDYTGKYTEYEPAKVIDTWNSPKGYLVAKVKIWYHNTGLIEEKNIKVEYLKKACYKMVNGEIMFKTALELEGKQIISGYLEYLRINDKCKDEGYLNSVCWEF
jgi:hypothetical protein